MAPDLAGIASQITFLYYHDPRLAEEFYGRVMGFELVEDQRWAKIYRASGKGFVGIVAGDRGFHTPQPRNAVLLTFVTEDVDGWHSHLQKAGVKLLSDVLEREDIKIRCFFFEDPGGYALEMQQFLRPGPRAIFHAEQRACPTASVERSGEGG